MLNSFPRDWQLAPPDGRINFRWLRLPSCQCGLTRKVVQRDWRSVPHATASPDSSRVLSRFGLTRRDSKIPNTLQISRFDANGHDGYFPHSLVQHDCTSHMTTPYSCHRSLLPIGAHADHRKLALNCHRNHAESPMAVGDLRIVNSRQLRDAPWVITSGAPSLTS